MKAGLALAAVLVVVIVVLLVGIGADFRQQKENCEQVGRVVSTSNQGDWICVDGEGRILGEREDF